MNGKSSTLLIIIIAALALFCFAVKSFYDYQVTKLKLEHGMDPAQATASDPAAGAPAVPQLPVAAAPTPAPAPAPAASDPELEKIKAELEALRQENIVKDQKIAEIRDATAVAEAEAAAAAVAAAAVAAETALAETSAVTPAEQAELDALRSQVTKAPAIGQIARCDWDFDLVWINGGADRNLKVEDKFAVRRGYEIMGFVTVEEVFDTYSVTKLTSGNRDSETARRPQPGDDVIKWPLF